MTITHLLEDFTHGTMSAGLELNQAALEEERLSAFEQGYQAGWDDSLQAAGGTEKKALEDMASTLSALSLSKTEIYAELLVSLRPLISDLVDSVLPVILKDSLGVQIKSLIQAHLEANESRDIVISLAKGQSDILNALTPYLSDLPCRFVEEGGFAPTQIRIGFGTDEEQEIDTQKLIAEIKTYIDRFFEDEVQTMQERT